MENIVLIGFMGSGKTEVGKRLAEKLGYIFTDTDSVIEIKTGRTIADIFSEYGESRFRGLEKEVVSGLSGIRGHVISTGGGIVTDRENVRGLKELGLLAWLKASPETIYERVKSEYHRPLLKVEDPLDEIRRLLDEREEMYAEADVKIDTDDIEVEEIVDIIMNAYIKRQRVSEGLG